MVRGVRRDSSARTPEHFSGSHTRLGHGHICCIPNSNLSRQLERMRLNNCYITLELTLDSGTGRGKTENRGKEEVKRTAEERALYTGQPDEQSVSQQNHNRHQLCTGHYTLLSRGSPEV